MSTGIRAVSDEQVGAFRRDVEEAGTRDRSPWHQDRPYYCIDGSQTVSFWIPLDAVARPSTLESAAGSPARRRAFSLRLVGDDVRCAPRPHRTSPPFDELEGVLAPGAPLEHPLFPVLWRG